MFPNATIHYLLDMQQWISRANLHERLMYRILLSVPHIGCILLVKNTDMLDTLKRIR